MLRPHFLQFLQPLRGLRADARPGSFEVADADRGWARASGFEEGSKEKMRAKDEEGTGPWRLCVDAADDTGDVDASGALDALGFKRTEEGEQDADERGARSVLEWLVGEAV